MKGFPQAWLGQCTNKISVCTVGQAWKPFLSEVTVPGISRDRPPGPRDSPGCWDHRHKRETGGDAPTSRRTLPGVPPHSPPGSTFGSHRRDPSTRVDKRGAQSGECPALRAGGEFRTSPWSERFSCELSFLLFFQFTRIIV